MLTAGIARNSNANGWCQDMHTKSVFSDEREQLACPQANWHKTTQNTRTGGLYQDMYANNARYTGQKAARVLAKDPAVALEERVAIPEWSSSVDEWGCSWRFFGTPLGTCHLKGDMQGQKWAAIWLDEDMRIQGAFACIDETGVDDQVGGQV